jgi:hypothetical protein
MIPESIRNIGRRFVNYTTPNAGGVSHEAFGRYNGDRHSIPDRIGVHAFDGDFCGAGSTHGARI